MHDTPSAKILPIVPKGQSARQWKGNHVSFSIFNGKITEHEMADLVRRPDGVALRRWSKPAASSTPPELAAAAWRLFVRLSELLKKMKKTWSEGLVCGRYLERSPSPNP